MNRTALVVAFSFCGATMLATFGACGGSNSPGFGGSSGSGGSSGGTGSGSGGSGSGSSSGGFSSSGSGGSGSGSSSGGGGASCVAGAQCNVPCSGSTTTTITGTVMDPAGKDPLYNIIAYVPSTTVEALPSGVPTGSAACSCSALFSGNPIAVAQTGVDGTFTIQNAPVGTDIPLVIQVGKWRTQTKVTTTACQANSAGTINLPGNSSQGDLPDIAVSTGGADSLECLLTRIGISASEYVPGYTKPGHVHIFNGGETTSQTTAGGGRPETQQMAGAPNSPDTGGLWDTSADLLKNDIVLLSCEGGETLNALPANLETYLNQGGRVFSSHFHYAWFTGSTEGSGYSAPSDWGDNLASWSTGNGTGGGGLNNNTVGGTIVTTLTVGGGQFDKGLAMQAWLGESPVSALGQSGVPSGELAVAEPRFNASVTTQAPSQSWIQADSNAGAGSDPTLFFSFDTPVGGVPNTSPAQYCGRAVFSGLHVGGASYDGVNCSSSAGSSGGFPGGGGGGQGCNTGHVAAAPPPTGCDTTHGLSPQEKALEFMLFDLSSCVVADNVSPDAGVPPIQQPR